MRLWGRAPMGAVAQAGQRTSEFRKAGSSAPQRGCREPKLILVSVLLRRSSRGHLSVQVQSCSHFRVQQSRAGRGRGGRACLKCSLWALAQPVLLVWTVCGWDPVICILITILSLFPGLLRPMTCLPGSSKQWKFVLTVPDTEVHTEFSRAEIKVSAGLDPPGGLQGRIRSWPLPASGDGRIPWLVAPSLQSLPLSSYRLSSSVFSLSAFLL